MSRPQFRKAENYTESAVMFLMLDIELLDSGDLDSRKPNLKYFGLGILPPEGRVPFRVKKRL